MRRDKEVNEYLEKCGWSVIRVWECELLLKNIIKLKEKFVAFEDDGTNY